MTDIELANEIISRLNAVISDPAIRRDVGRLIETRIVSSSETNAHPTIQVGETGRLGFLGLLNGLVGIREDGWGYVAARFSGDKDNLGELEVFELTARTT